MIFTKIIKKFVLLFDRWYDPALDNPNISFKLDAINNSIVDGTGIHTISNNGLATINTTESTPFSASSIQFNGQPNCGLVISSPQDMNFNKSDFTIEMIKPYSVGSAYNCIFSTDTSSTSGTIWFGIGPDGTLTIWPFLQPSKFFSTIALVSANEWQHVAVTRHGDVITVWKNGQLALQAPFTTNLTYPMMYIGETISKTQQFNGLISGFRVTKNVCLYTNDFGIPEYQ